MIFLEDIWENIPNLINDDFDNKLDKRDACRIIYVAAKKNYISIDTFETRICDVFRNFKNNYYEKYLLSMHLISLKKFLNNFFVLLFFLKWFRMRNLNVIKFTFYFMKALLLSPLSYLKRFKYFIL